MRTRLEVGLQADREVTAYTAPIQPQRKKEALRKRLYQDARSIADTVINRVGFKHGGRNLIRFFPGRGDTNIALLVAVIFWGAPAGAQSFYQGKSIRVIVGRALTSTLRAKTEGVTR